MCATPTYFNLKHIKTIGNKVIAVASDKDRNEYHIPINSDEVQSCPVHE